MARAALSPLLRSFERHLRAENRSERRDPSAGLTGCGRVRTETVPWARPGADALLELAEVLARSDRRDEARIVAAEAKRLYAEKGNAIALAPATAALDAISVAETP